VSAEKYMKAESASQLTVDASGTGASTIVYLSGSNGTYTMKMQGLNVFTNSNSSPSTLTSNDKTTYLAVPVVSGKLSPGKVTIGNGATATDFHCVSGSNVQSIATGSNTDDNTAAYWTFEDADDATLSLNSDGAVSATYYATFCAPFSYTVSDGTKAYTLEQSGDWLVPTEVVGTVAAGTPVLLKGTSTTATLTIGTEWATSPAGGTALTGTYLAATIDGATDYVLGIDSGVVGFYHWNTNSLGANRAYYDTPAADPGVKGYVLKFDEDATGLEGVQDVQEAQGAIYNLAGQRLNKIQKGINIVNGKKILK
nr:hypothetical protein [Bacteroidaceae bacterium]